MDGVEREEEAARGATEAESSAGISSGFKPIMASLYDKDFGRSLGVRAFCCGFLSPRSIEPTLSGAGEDAGERASANLERSLGLFETGEEVSARASVGIRDTVRTGGLGTARFLTGGALVRLGDFFTRSEGDDEEESVGGSCESFAIFMDIDRVMPFLVGAG